MSLSGSFFEDLTLARRFRHPTPRTITDGDISLYIALTGARQPLHSSAVLARSFGYPNRTVDDLLVFNMAFGKSVPDISLNAVSNLGYADVRFLRPIYPGDTLWAESEVIGRRETSDGGNSIVYVRSNAFSASGQCVLTWVRWVMIKKRSSAPDTGSFLPQLPTSVSSNDLSVICENVNLNILFEATASERLWHDYRAGERIDHPSGMTVDESDHTLATKLYQNTARVHFDARIMSDTPHKRRLVYGGHVISVCRALSYDGLENVGGILAINAGTHRAPTYAGDTLYAFTEVLECLALPDRNDIGVLRLRLVGIKNQSSQGFYDKSTGDERASFDPAVVLDLDYLVWIPRAQTRKAS